MGRRRERYCKWQRNLSKPSAAPMMRPLRFEDEGADRACT